MVTPNKRLNLPAYDSPGWDVPLNENFGWIDDGFGKTANINVGTGTGATTLTTAQYRSAILDFSGNPSGPIIYNIPAGIGGYWIVRNNFDDDDHPLTIKILPNGGAECPIPWTQARLIYSDGSTNVRYANIYGENQEVLFNAGGNVVDGASNFKYDGTNLRVPRVRAGSGDAQNPVFGVDASSITLGSGMFFSGAADAKLVGFSTSGLQRMLINKDGALGFGQPTGNYGVAGQFLKTIGDTGHPVWGTVGVTQVGNDNVGTGTFVSVALDDLNPYSFLVAVIRGMSHNASGDRTFTVSGGCAISKAVGGGTFLSGIVFVHLGAGVGMATTGNAIGAESVAFSSGLITSLSHASNAIRFDISGGTASFDGGGTINVYGIA